MSKRNKKHKNLTLERKIALAAALVNLVSTLINIINKLTE